MAENTSKSMTDKWQFWGLVVAALIGLGGVIFQTCGPGIGGHKKYVSGVVADAKSKGSIQGAVVALKTDEGRVVRQDTTDGAGQFSLEIPPDLVTIRLAATADGYSPYDRKLPAEAAKNDIFLDHLGFVVGVPQNAPLDGTMQTIAARMNVTVVFSKDCTKRARSTTLVGGQIEGSAPEVVFGALLNQVKGLGVQYDVNTIETGRRYEIRCH